MKIKNAHMQAFPFIEPASNEAIKAYHPGMTLRDYFAAHADLSIYTPLENLTSQLHRKPTIGEMAEYIASIRFIEADAMLKARKA